MIILKNDFYSSFAGAVKSQDSDLIKQMTLNQISDLVAYDEKSVTGLLNKTGVPIASDASDKEIVKSLVENMPKNEKLCKGIAFMVADNNDLLKVKSGADGKGNKKSLYNVINNIRDGFSSVVGDMNNGVKKVEIEAQLNNEVENKVKTAGLKKTSNEKKSSSKKSKLIWWIFGGAVLTLGALAVYSYFKGKSITTLESGGGLPSGNQNPPTIVPPPSNPVPPIPPVPPAPPPTPMNPPVQNIPPTPQV